MTEGAEDLRQSLDIIGEELRKGVDVRDRKYHLTTYK